MDEHQFIQVIYEKAKTTGINPLLLLSGIEGLYSFKDVEINRINFEFLDSLILTIFALRVGDKFHSLAEENLKSDNPQLLQGAAQELRILSIPEIEASANYYLHSFAKILGGKTNIRVYHIKALEAAAIEIRKAQIAFSDNSIGSIVMQLCKDHLADDIDLGSLFQSR
jgi:hypothetical protein